MVTSVFIVPFTVFEQCNFSIKKATQKIVRLCFSFVFTLVITFHLGTIFSVGRSDTFSYAGSAKVPLVGAGGKFLQYFNFIGSCFLAPRAENIIRYGKRTWFLSNVKNLNLVGVIIFCLIVLSIAINFRDKLCRASAIWIGFSIILFIIGGYGVKDNELAIYLLYFSWAFVVLLIKLISKLHEKVIVLIEFFGLSVCYIFNTIDIINLIDFSCQYYPF